MEKGEGVWEKGGKKRGRFGGWKIGADGERSRGSNRSSDGKFGRG